MDDLCVNILIGLGTGVVSGVVTGIYSGRIIARRNRFDSLRSDLLRHANSVEYMQEQGRVAIKCGTSAQILYVASDLAHFGHRQAAEAVLSGNQRLAAALNDAARGSIDVRAVENQLKEIRDSFRSIKPSNVYLPWGQV
ncbi:hypothetical protein ASD68_12695 [Rhodanobacter sp. Root627]|uniref:hypothetical protein n=1 Tax=Rhodanobacter sp. Root627 TaxID=1736572 RepID=UPI00070028E7|nr:hypothetical protein [Rhodanobacter sp. Root627]KRA33802.1 hypothetical protein ASD68_12695 [Rhodanobacter sp. Root627]